MESSRPCFDSGALDMRLLLVITVLCFWVVTDSFTAFSQEGLLSLDEFKALVKENKTKKRSKYLEPWYRFRDFDKLLATLSIEELKEYERAQRVHIDLDSPKTENIRKIDELDLIAFQRAYPHLASAFQDPIIRAQFQEHYSMRYSYGWKRWGTWRSFRLTYNAAAKQGVKLRPVYMDLTNSYMQKGYKNKTVLQGTLGLSFEKIVKLALCDDYKPAVMDVMRAARVQGELKLSAPLSYMHMLRSREKNIRLVYEDKWQAEIDAGLTADEKKKYQELMRSKDRLRKDLQFCSG